MDNAEPWLRGPLAGVHPLIMPVFFSFALVREELEKFIAPLPLDQVWCLVEGNSIGFHLKHLAGSVDRLTTYLMDEQLSDAQLENLKHESAGNETATELIRHVNAALIDSESSLQTLNPDLLYEVRNVGRRHLPTTVIGLLVHIAEHTQRHLGQAITLAKIMRQAA